MFELTPELVDSIGFAMEDQGKRHVIDVDTGELMIVESIPAGSPEDHYVPLPTWGPAEGFHLMESFVTSLYNPVYRELLATALNSGKGVFRAFKDILKRNHEIERLWFGYKEKKLRSVIVRLVQSHQRGQRAGKVAAGA